jgi:hypothetical protein
MREWQREQELPKQCVFCSGVERLTNGSFDSKEQGR